MVETSESPKLEPGGIGGMEFIMGVNVQPQSPLGNSTNKQ